jgi:hypothetical protein
VIGTVGNGPHIHFEAFAGEPLSKALGDFFAR